MLRSSGGRQTSVVLRRQIRIVFFGDGDVPPLLSSTVIRVRPQARRLDVKKKRYTEEQIIGFCGRRTRAWR